MSGFETYLRAMEYGAGQYEDVLALLAELGFHAFFTQTGGMCPAIKLELDSQRFALITDEDGPLAWERHDHHGWAVGIYAVEDTSDALTLQTSADGSPGALLRLLPPLP